MRHFRGFGLVCAAVAALSVILSSSSFAQVINIAKYIHNNPDGSQTLLNHVRHEVASGLVTKVSSLDSNQMIDLLFIVPSQDPAGLQNFIKQVYNPNSPLYHQFLTPQQFDQQFGASSVNSSIIIQNLQSQGLTFKGQSKNGFIIYATGTVSAVESAFKVNLNNYQRADGTMFYATASNPTLAPQLAGTISAIVGLDNAPSFRPHLHRGAQLAPALKPATNLMTPSVLPSSVPAMSIAIRGPNGLVTIKNGSTQTNTSPAPGFSGIDGYMGPSDIKTAYNLNSVSSTGSGQTLSLFELDGYEQSDISQFESHYGVSVPLNPIYVDSYDGSAGSGTDEVVLDIDLTMSVAPGLNSINVYEAADSGTGWVDEWNQIATDNTAKVISCSWGLYEDADFTYYYLNTNSIFAQMAAQGQAVFASSGDFGAYDECTDLLPPLCNEEGVACCTAPELTTLAVDYPASDPNVTGVGISAVTVNGSGAYLSETASLYGGGGVSNVVTIPSYQLTAATNASSFAQVSTTYRNVPDLSFTADPSTLYGIYIHDGPSQAPVGWYGFWGSSAATPIWASFTALVNQGRLAAAAAGAAGQVTSTGFLNPLVYQVAKTSKYSTDFHDISTGNNSNYSAETGYDAATGLGSFNGANLYNDLVGPGVPTGLTPTAGNAQISLTWTASTGAVSYNIQRSTVSGGPYTTISTSGAVTTTNYTDSPLSAGTYYYVVSAVNAAGIQGAYSTEVSSSPIISVAPNITTQPSNQTVSAPSTATFTVVATGTPAPTYQWIESTDNGSTWTRINGATSASYTTLATTAADNGTQFQCNITNSAGSVASNVVTLTVNAAPIITTQPSNQTVTAPATATFTVVATGAPTPTYQWQQSTDSGNTWTAIGGATSAAYTTPATSLSNSGNQFECVITNSNGTVTSNAATLTVYSLPNITTQPVNQTVTAPATATFSVTATGTPAPSYQWKQSLDNGTTWTAISGATSSSYTTLATTGANDGNQFECVITNTAGSVTSNPVTLTVDAIPSITTQPSNQTVTAPAPASFTVVAAGQPTPTYQWQQSTDNGSTWTAIGGATSATYTTPATSLSNSGNQFECVITNSNGSVTSNAAILTVDSLPNIGTQPISQTVTAPATATFSVSATGTPTPTYQWEISTNSGSTWTAISGANASSYTTPATTVNNNGNEFECVVTNTAGSVTSTAAVLTVNAVPNITTQPSNQTVTAPSTATFTVVATGAPTPTYQWNLSTDGGSTWSAISGATSASYVTPATTLSNNGNEFNCVITNSVGYVITVPVTLTVNTVPSISVQPSNQTVTAPAPAVFSVTAAGSPAPSYQWMLSINSGSSWNVISGATSSSYTTPATSSIDNGYQYKCVITNTAGSVNSNEATLTVNAVPSITTQPINQTVTAPATASFTVAATGLPIPTYQWQESTDNGSTWTAISGATNATYTTPATILSNSGYQFECVVTNSVGSVTSTAATLTVNTLPSITSQPSNQTVLAPATAIFTVAATGSPSPTYQWQESTNNGSTWSAISGATTNTYTTPATSYANNGYQFECVVTNNAGSVTSNAVTLTVNAVPSPPISVQATAGNAQATVRFSGALPNGSAITRYTVTSSPGGITATGSISPIMISGLSNGTSYSFTVTATNANGTSVASVASNSVTPSTIAGPTNLSAQVLGLRIYHRIIHLGVLLNWRQSTSSGIRFNRIYRSANAGPYVMVAVIRQDRDFTDKGLATGVTYSYEVTAVDLSGNESAPAGPVSVNY